MSHGKQFSKMLGAQIKMTFREKQAWFWGIFFPVILMVIFMVIFGSGSSEDFEAKIAVVDESPNPASAAMLEQLRSIPMFQIEGGAAVSREEAETLVKEKDISAAVILPQSAEGAGELKLIVHKETERGATAQTVAAVLNQFVQQANLAAAGAAPVYSFALESIAEGGEELDYTDFLLTGMIALSIAQGGLFGMVDMVEMRRKGLLKRLRMTPANMGLFGLSDMTVRMLFAVVQIVLLSLIGVFGFGASLNIDVLSLVVIFLMGILAFTAMGYLFSSLCKTMEAYMGVANITSFVMMFLTGIFFPIESMPSWLHPVAAVLPLTYFVDGLRSAMVYSTGIFTSAFWAGVGILALWGAVAFALGSWVYRSKSIAATR